MIPAAKFDTLLPEALDLRQLDLAQPATVWRVRTGLLVAAVTLIRLLVIGTTTIANGEAYYASWARFPALSYYDHPPLVAWMTWLFTQFGDSEFTVRIGVVLCSGLSALLLYRLAERMFSPRAGFIAVVMLTAMPVFIVHAYALNPEAPLAPLWVLALLLIEDLRHHEEWWRPLLAGAAIGLAFLAKYSGVVLIFATLAYLAASPRCRHWLKRPSLYVGALVALAVTSPVLIWNFERGWPSLTLHLVERSAPLSLSAMLANVPHVLFNEWMFFHPLFFPAELLLMVLVYRRAKADDRYRFLFWTSVPVFAFFVTAMIRVKDPEMHWSMVAFFSLMVAAGAWLDDNLERLSTAMKWFLRIGVTASLVVFLVVYTYIQMPGLRRFVPGGGKSDMFSEMIGWDEVGGGVRAGLAELGPNAVVAGSQYALCAHLLRELGDSPNVYCPSERRTQFDFWDRRNPPATAPVLFVSDDHYNPPAESLLPDRDCRLVRDLTVEREGQVLQTYHLAACLPRQTPRATLSAK